MHLRGHYCQQGPALRQPACAPWPTASHTRTEANPDGCMVVLLRVSATACNCGWYLCQLEQTTAAHALLTSFSLAMISSIALRLDPFPPAPAALPSSSSMSNTAAAAAGVSAAERAAPAPAPASTAEEGPGPAARERVMGPCRQTRTYTYTYMCAGKKCSQYEGAKVSTSCCMFWPCFNHT